MWEIRVTVEKFFAYIGNHTTIIAKIFRRYNMNVAFKAYIILEKHICHKRPFNDPQTEVEYKLNWHDSKGYHTG